MTQEDQNCKRADKVRLAVEREMKILQAAAPNAVFPEFPERARIKNISEGGLCINTDKEIKKGMVIESEILLRGNNLNRFKAYCQAVWVKKNSEDGSFDIGLQFLGIKDADLEQLSEYIQTRYH